MMILTQWFTADFYNNMESIMYQTQVQSIELSKDSNEIEGVRSSSVSGDIMYCAETNKSGKQSRMAVIVAIQVSTNKVIGK